MEYLNTSYHDTNTDRDVDVFSGSLIVSGTLEIKDGASVVNFPYPDPAVAANQADSTATTVAGLKEDFNALLAKLKTAGLMEPDEEAQG